MLKIFFNASDAGKNGFEHDVTNYEFREDWVLAGDTQYVGKFVSSLIFGIGFLMIAFTERKQALHDQFVGH